MTPGQRVLAALGLALWVVPASAEDYPADSVAAISASCRQRQDVPQWAAPTFCACYVERVRAKISWSEWKRVDLALAEKGRDGLDPGERAILAKAVDAALYCQAMTVR